MGVIQPLASTAVQVHCSVAQVSNLSLPSLLPCRIMAAAAANFLVCLFCAEVQVRTSIISSQFCGTAGLKISFLVDWQILIKQNKNELSKSSIEEDSISEYGFLNHGSLYGYLDFQGRVIAE